MEIMTKDKLREISEEALRKVDIEIIDNIVRLVYNQVISKAQNLEGTSLEWNPSTGYIFGGFHHIRYIHIVRACVRLQQFFPDSTIKILQNNAITVDWA
jgi:hypothetical protein